MVTTYVFAAICGTVISPLNAPFSSVFKVPSIVGFEGLSLMKNEISFDASKPTPDTAIFSPPKAAEVAKVSLGSTSKVLVVLPFP